MLIRNRFIPFGDFAAINILGIIFIKYGVRADRQLINHENIHTAQQKELLWLPFFIFYMAEWLWHMLQTRSVKKAYYRISFEREAYANDANLRYLSRRPRFAMWRK